MFSLVSSQIQAEPPPASAEHGGQEEEEAKVQQKKVKWPKCFWREIKYGQCCICLKKLCVCLVFFLILISENSTKEPRDISSCCSAGWGGRGYLHHLLWAVDQCRGPPSLSIAVWTPVWLHVHWKVAQGTGREVPPGKTDISVHGRGLAIR